MSDRYFDIFQEAEVSLDYIYHEGEDAVYIAIEHPAGDWFSDDTFTELVLYLPIKEADKAAKEFKRMRDAYELKLNIAG